jgi:hypothetical protein
MAALKGPDRAAILENWAPLVGKPAAIAIYRGRRIISLTPLVCLGYVLVIYLSVHLAPSAAPWIAAFLGIVCFVLVCSSAFFLRQWHRNAGKALGLRITSKNALRETTTIFGRGASAMMCNPSPPRRSNHEGAPCRRYRAPPCRSSSNGGGLPFR